MPPPSPTPQAVNLFEKFDNFSDLRNGLKHIAVKQDEYAGIPMPLEGHNLVIAPSYARGREIMEATNTKPNPPIEGQAVSIRNSFWSNKLQAELYICDEADGSIGARVLPFSPKLGLLLGTMDCSLVWGLEQEHVATRLLGTLIRHDQLKMYLLTGMFAERSSRSQITYVFRRLRPTLAISTRGPTARCIAALCMHPIGYYESTWAGVMPPTDEVIAHLQMMRGDEKLYWRRANQHHPRHPSAGI